jgi:hypothetical protein
VSRGRELIEWRDIDHWHARAVEAEREASRYREALRGLQEQAQWLLDHWTEPAFVRFKMQEAALALARAALKAYGDEGVSEPLAKGSRLASGGSLTSSVQDPPGQT